MPSIGVNLRVTGHCSQGGRKYMEDFFSVAYQQSFTDERDLEYAFIGIYDGHGGADAAQFAKEHLINLIVNQKAFWSDDDRDVLRAIREGYIATHYAMWREQEKWPRTATGLPSTAGTTASVAFIRHGKIYIGHAGDSGIVLGVQEDGHKHWSAKRLTQDHKPESHAEKTRITNSGGKVIVKAGVPRVVWNRPRCKGPVRRSTPIDEIPFLAVARSLGDLWSYNSALNEFVVSPDPDVLVVPIDPKRFKCLVFGTDGLWNVVTAQGAVDNVRISEQMNERNACLGETREWINPSKNLVDKALERWSTKKMRADNTSVVIIMLDPPGPAKRDTLKSSPSQDYPLDYLEPADEIIDQPSQHLEIEPIQNFTMFDHSTNEHIDMDGMPLTVLTRFENVTDNSDIHKNQQQQQTFENTIETESNHTDVPYMNSFAESYNSLLNSSLANDHSYIYGSESSDTDDDFTCDEMNNTHQYMDNNYSLTKLQTRSEQLCYANSLPSTSHSMYANYKHNLVDHNYLGETDAYESTSKNYEHNSLVSNNVHHDNLANASKQTKLMKVVAVSKHEHHRNDKLNANRRHSNHMDNSIQINEISSSDNNDSSIDTRLKRSNSQQMKKDDSIERKVTRSSLASKSLFERIATRSAGIEKKPRSIATSNRNLKQKVTVIIAKQTPTTTNKEKNARPHKENISIVRKMPVEALVNNAIVNQMQTRHSIATSKLNGNDAELNQRTLRSQNAFIKEIITTKSLAKYNRSSTQQNHIQNVSNNSIPQTLKNVAHNKLHSIATRANVITTTNNAKSIIVRKLPKRLLNETVQIVKTNNSNYNNNNNKQQLRSQTNQMSRQSAIVSTASTITHGTRKTTVTPQPRTLLKVLVSKKPLLMERCSQLLADVKRNTVITRRMRLQQ